MNRQGVSSKMMFVYAFAGYTLAILLALQRNGLVEIFSCVPGAVALYFTFRLLLSFTNKEEKED